MDALFHSCFLHFYLFFSILSGSFVFHSFACQPTTNLAVHQSHARPSSSRASCLSSTAGVMHRLVSGRRTPALSLPLSPSLSLPHSGYGRLLLIELCTPTGPFAMSSISMSPYSISRPFASIYHSIFLLRSLLLYYSHFSSIIYFIKRILLHLNWQSRHV